ncbi:MAG TPA: hypothetical protein VIF37_16005 [Methylobacter sp.]|jgi:hypothetical protein
MQSRRAAPRVVVNTLKYRPYKYRTQRVPYGIPAQRVGTRKKADLGRKQPVNVRFSTEYTPRVRIVVADQLALEQYEKFNQHRLAVEAEQEAFLDDAELQNYLAKNNERAKQYCPPYRHLAMKLLST